MQQQKQMFQHGTLHMRQGVVEAAAAVALENQKDSDNALWLQAAVNASSALDPRRSAAEPEPPKILRMDSHTSEWLASPIKISAKKNVGPLHFHTSHTS
jgi:alpha-D-ribose 1-methylphosphonate 5-triphosphate synthase subunit PhnH